RNNTDYAANWALENPENFEELYQLIFSENAKVAWRAAWVLEKSQLKHSEIFTDKITEIISSLPHFKHDGSKRCLLLIIMRSPLPDPIPVDLINICFDWMMSAKESVAVQVNSMKILDKICEQEPDLRHEMNMCLSGDLSDYSKGFQTTAKNILKRKK
ncbi:hypothetical protein LJC11_05105, partial [Bacteroidales bacterium OttesenSCG-928-I21]|nr:hypothetical protein [Bacteroidales bacterium OttesenSCG-928-I21]